MNPLCRSDAAVRWFVVLVLTAFLGITGAQAAEKRVRPFNRIVVLLDASGSFQRRQDEALAKTGKLLAGLAAHKAKRWEQADEIKIVSLDAIPEMIWEGTPEQLAKVEKTNWAGRFKARQDYAKCTDVVAGLELAASILEDEPVPTEKYLFVFSDLIHEPPIGVPTKCQAPKLPSVPGKDFGWDRLADIKMAVFWMPPAQKMAWDRAMKEHGLTGYRLYTTAESAIASLDIPEPAKRKVTEAERQDGRKTLGGLFDGVLMVAGGGLVLLVVAGLGIAIRAKIRSRRRGAPAAQAGRTVRGPVPPMRVPRNPA
ncbi:MAG: hypothetical protein K1X67_26710 [Fimbriimonadaceae bacterium]|nr:hypothetical protein [Fimbriimonadaceae bacterium]